MNTTPTTPEELLNYWPGSIPFKGSLVSDDGTCMCAQGQALHFLDGVSPVELASFDQRKADQRVAELFGISVTHSVLLRQINDRWPGAPSVVIRDPAQVLGDQAEVILAFWRHLDSMTPAACEAAREAAAVAAREAAWEAAGAAAREAAGEAAAVAAWAAARDAAWEAAGAAAGGSNEIQGAAILRAEGKPFFFLPMFGFATP
jgi:hypothetical protein